MPHHPLPAREYTLATGDRSLADFDLISVQISQGFSIEVEIFMDFKLNKRIGEQARVIFPREGMTGSSTM